MDFATAIVWAYFNLEFDLQDLVGYTRLKKCDSAQYCAWQMGSFLLLRAKASGCGRHVRAMQVLLLPNFIMIVHE